MAYALETILSEKIETILSRNIANTRPRDFYDVYILYSLRWRECRVPILRIALDRTANNRGPNSVLGHYESIVANIRINPRMHDFWSNYQKVFKFVKSVRFEDTGNMVLTIMKPLQA